MQWLATLNIPAYGRLPLVGDTDSLDAVFGEAFLLEDLDGAFYAVLDRLDDLVRVVLVPAGKLSEGDAAW